MDTPPLSPCVDCSSDGLPAEHKQTADIATYVPRLPSEPTSVDVEDAHQLRPGIEFLLRLHSGRDVHPEIVERIIRDANEKYKHSQGQASILSIVREMIKNVGVLSDTDTLDTSSHVSRIARQAAVELRRLDPDMLRAVSAYYLDRTNENAIAESAGVPLDRLRKTRQELRKAVGTLRIGAHWNANDCAEER